MCRLGIAFKDRLSNNVGKNFESGAVTNFLEDILLWIKRSGKFPSPYPSTIKGKNVFEDEDCMVINFG